MDEEALQRIHARLLAGDPTASHDLVVNHSPRLLAQLRRRWRATPRELCEEAALEALFGYLRAPHAYDRARGALDRYLYWSAHRDLQNVLEREERQRLPRTQSLDRVELGGQERKGTVGDRIADPQSDPERWLDEIDPALLAEIAAAIPDERDRQVFNLIARGEKRTETFAAVLGLAGLPPDEHRRQVKRAKDRIRIRIRRRLKGQGRTEG
ncbi:MAG TPA: hypothetical protein VLA19_31850 [Herpetosiphonaceae bacterium]|nr:hypothetical protein [Herpetosiphonaceae bacterium]